MKRFFLIIASLFLLTAGKAQSIHKDQLEYGYKGAVKVIVKKNFVNPIEIDDDITPADSNLATTYTYYFNEHGNMDSATTERVTLFGEVFFYKAHYEFDRLRKTGWAAFNKDNENLAYGKISWDSDKALTEKVYDPNAKLKYETTTILNDSFRIVKLKIKAFDETGNLIQDDIQEFQLDELQQIALYKTIHQKDGSTEITDYKYFGIDKTGNPTKLVMSNKTRETKILVTIDYSYYH